MHYHASPKLLVLNDNALVNAAEESLLAPDELAGLGCVVLDLVLPQRFGERLKVVIDHFQDVADRLPFRRIVVVDENRLAPFGSLFSM